MIITLSWVCLHVEVILQWLVAVVQEGTLCARWGELGKSCCPADFTKACKTVLCLKLLKDPVLPWHLLLSPSRSSCCFSLDLGTDWFDQYFFFSVQALLSFYTLSSSVLWTNNVWKVLRTNVQRFVCFEVIHQTESLLLLHWKHWIYRVF